jgi:glycosyltransferase involved in cell wall biosynthesis
LTDPGGELVTIVIPARNAAGNIAGAVSRILAEVRSRCEILVVVDHADDPTRAAVRAIAAAEPRVRCLVSRYGPGPANAISYGIEYAKGNVTVVTMPDDSDDPRQIDDLVALVRQGAVIAAASRYARGGHQVGGPAVRRLIARIAGRSLERFARAGITDATNSFKAYSTGFVCEVGIHSGAGFAIGIELTAKARRLRLRVAEVPTTWRHRTAGPSRFRTAAWLPVYLRWYAFCFGRKLSVAELRRRAARTARSALADRPSGKITSLGRHAARLGGVTAGRSALAGAPRQR